MKKLYQEILLKIVKLLNVALMTAPFAVCWYEYYAKRIVMPFQGKGNVLTLVVFVLLYIVFARLYEGFLIQIKQISEIAYSQSLAVLVTDGILFLVTWLLTRAFPNPLPLLVVAVVQILIAAGWAMLVHAWFFSSFPADRSAIVFDNQSGLEKLIAEYGLHQRFSVKLKMNVEDCIKDLSVLDTMQTVFISGVHSHERNIILKYCIAHDIEVLVIPRIGDVLMSSAQSVHMFHLPMLQVRRYAASPEFLFVKRLLDIVISLVALILLSPIMIVVAIAIKAYDGGPAFYSQVRLTKDNREFRILKFRSMRQDAERDGVARLSTGENDSRITPIGKVIRKLRLDELPQLINILKGDLSIVGPRPERPE
ncbi:exopolysaccharide biosynthesis polyprenyl glycosylphosphotransferase, partial [gut metagenome]